MSLADLFKKHAPSFDAADPAAERTVLPPGEYTATIIKGELMTSRSGTDGYKLTFTVCEGEPHAGERFWHDLWLTENAMSYTKRDLLKLDIHTFDQLQRPLLSGFRCRVKLAVRRSDDGAEYNRVTSFDVLGRDEHQPDPFAPSPGTPAADTSQADGKPATRSKRAKGGRK